MLRIVKAALVSMTVSALVMSCNLSEVTLLGQPMPPLPAGCPVAVFPSTTPNYQWRDIATARTYCQSSYRTGCIEQLKSEACKLGADTVYGIYEGGGAMTATIARSTGGAVAAVGPLPPGSGPSPVAAETCSPPCSPGYQCQGTTCVALCNPACAAGMHCANDRTCQRDR